MPLDSRSAQIEVAVARTREQVAELHAGAARAGLITATGGNISARVPEAELFVITPRGSGRTAPGPGEVILCGLDGVAVQDAPGSSGPASIDTAAHAFLYRSMPEVGGIAHSHSPYATAWAAAGEPIPCVLTAIAREFGGEIPVGPFALPGDDSIGRGILETLSAHRSRAVLMRGHGAFAVGADAGAAVTTISMVEDAAQTVLLARGIGRPDVLPPAEIDLLFHPGRTAQLAHP